MLWDATVGTKSGPGGAKSGPGEVKALQGRLIQEAGWLGEPARG